MAHSILIVDDEPGIRQSLRGVLEDEGFSVAAVATGEECLRALDERLFSLCPARCLASGNGWP
jgi:two-component system nitrogen regulation response regulator NtrX